MSNNVTMSYGDYDFSPVPFLSINKVYNTTSDGKRIGTTFQVTVDGTLVLYPTGGYVSVDEAQEGLRAAFANNGYRFLVECDSTTIIEAYPRVNQINFSPSNDNWVFTSPYQVTMEWDEEPSASGEDNPGLMPPYVSSASESWAVEFVEDSSKFTWDLDGTTDSNPYKLRVSRNISAVGKRHFQQDVGATGILRKEAWEEAKEYVVSKLTEADTEWGTHVSGVSVINLPAADFQRYDHIRTQNIDEAGGSYQLNETWLVIDPASTGVIADATEDFTVTTTTSAENGLTSISIEGSIQGLETRSYGVSADSFTITQDKYNAASGYWDTVQSRLYGRAIFAGEDTAYRTINPATLGTTVGHSPSRGVISYSYQYDDRPCNYISGAIKEDISIQDSNPTDIFSSIVIPGRAKGPILQDINTVTSSVRTVSITAIIQPPTGCHACDSVPGMISAQPTGEVQTLLCCLEQELTGSYDQVFKSQDQGTWNPKTGQYSRTVSWTYTNCTGAAPDTSFC
jgi:hypothetical protein